VPGFWTDLEARLPQLLDQLGDHHVFIEVGDLLAQVL
jgi:hypothetical protein